MSALGTLVTGTVLVVAMAVGWAVVQRAWGRSVGRGCPDPDALAGRASCGGCEHEDACERGVER
jgi:hypothetical protein